MRYFLSAARVLAMDFAATILFLVLWQFTHSIVLAASLGLALGVGQVAWKWARRQKADALQWVSLGLVVVSSTASILTNDSRFVMLKPTAIYAITGFAMLNRGWMNTYVPPIVRDTVPELVTVFGYVWAGLMFATGVLNVVLVRALDLGEWALAMSAWGLGSKAALFAAQFLIIRAAIVRKLRGAAAVAA